MVSHKAKKFIYRGIRTLPRSLLQPLEEAFQLAQGKGGGAQATQREVYSALSLLPEATKYNPIVLDVGANVGNWTAAVLDNAPMAELYVFEPSSKAFQQLQNRFLNDSRVHLIQAAVGSNVGVGRLWADVPGSGLGSMTKRRLEHFDIEFKHSEEVNVLTLDSCRQLALVQPDLLKMDVEGHELEVLKGATETLRSVQVVQFEFGGCNIDSRTFFQDYYYFFREQGFDIFRLEPRGLFSIESYTQLDETFATTNYFAQRR